jgi:hypothetical protein
MVFLQESTALIPTVSVWTLLAAIAATISAISAFRSSRFAKRELAHAGQTYQDRQANFTLYLFDGYRWTTKGCKRGLFGENNSLIFYFVFCEIGLLLSYIIVISHNIQLLKLGLKINNTENKTITTKIFNK